MARLDPWDELRIMARNAIAGDSSARGVGLQAGRCAYYTLDGTALEHAAAMNALKGLCLAWGRSPEPSAASLRAAIAALLNALDTWPPELRATKTASKFARPRPLPSVQPYYMRERD